MSDDGQTGTRVSKYVGRNRPLRTAFGIAVILALLCLSGLAAAATKKQDAKPILTIGLPFAPVSLDPSKDGAGFLIVRALTNTAITHIKPDGSIGPGLATSWRYLGSGGRSKGPDAGRGPNKDFEFTLRHHARFSDGTGVTAQAVKAWLEYFAKGSGAFASLMGPIRSIDTVGKWKVRIHLSSPNPVLPRVLSELYNWGAVSSARAVAASSVLGTQTAGAGPYMLDPSETVTNDHYTLVPNPYYYDKSAIRFSKVVAKVIPTASSMLQAVQTGQIDVGQGASATADAAEASGLNVVHAPNGYAGFILADRNGAASKPLADVRVRQALNYAIDRKAVTSAVVGKWGTPLAEMSSADGFVKTYANHYSYNPAKAKSLLSAAGYANGFTLDHLGLTSSYTQAIAKYLGDVGVRLKITIAPNATDYVAKRRTLQYSSLEQTYGRPDPMWILYSVLMHPKAALNPFGVDDPVMDKLWLNGQRAADPSVYWRQMSERATKQAYFLPAIATQAIYFAQKRVRGVAMSLARPYPLASEWSPK